MKNNVQTSKRAKRLGWLLGVGAGLYFLWRYLRLPMTVALIAWGVGATVAPMARFCEKKLRLPRRVSGVLCFLLLSSGVCAFLSWGISRLCEGMVRLTVWLGENRVVLSEKLGETMDFLSRFLSRLPFFSQIEQGQLTIEMQSFFNERLGQIVLRLGSEVTVGMGRVLAATPRAFLALIVSVVACIYTSMDYEHMREWVLSLFPSPWRARVASTCRCIPRLLLVTLRAYGVLMLITFAELWIGFGILRIKYAVWLAALIALIDLLPVLGTGTVLIPWSVVSLLSGETARGIGLLVLYAVVTVVRQMIEPYFLSKSMGVHPFVSLLAMLMGLELFGVLGMILSPMIVLLIRTAIGNGSKS